MHISAGMFRALNTDCRFAGRNALGAPKLRDYLRPLSNRY